MSNIYFVSDTHFSHTNIINYCNRPYKSVEEMDEDIIIKWNSKVTCDDVIYHLGDFSLGIKAVEKYCPRLNGKKHLIMGNHDLCHPANKKSRQYSVSDYKNIGFETVGLEQIITLNLKGKDTKVKLCHLPYEPNDNEKVDRRYMAIRPKDEGCLLLHGHVHTSFLMNKEKRMVNVGVDVWDMVPVSVEQIDKIVTDNNFEI